MKRNNTKKENKEIEPLPKILPISPPTKPEVTPKPEKNQPFQPSPEIQPVPKILPISPPVTKPEVKPQPEITEPFQPVPENTTKQES